MGPRDSCQRAVKRGDSECQSTAHGLRKVSHDFRHVMPAVHEY